MTTTLEKLSYWGADVNQALARFLNDEELYKECLQMFKADDNFQQLGSSITDENYEQAFENAHTLKGVAGNLALTPLYTAISEIVESLRCNDCYNLKQQYIHIMEKYEEFKQLF